MHILNPDKEPLPWRAYCTNQPSTFFTTDLPASAQISTQAPLSSSPRVTRPPFPPNNLEDLPPAGLFIGVFSVDSAFERRMLIRTTWASHDRSRAGAGQGDGGIGTSRTIVRFVLGQPRKAWERRIKLEMEMYNDIVILPVAENMNSGKTHTFFSWAYLNAWVPPVYTDSRLPPPRFSYSDHTSIPPTLAPHDPVQAWRDQALNETQYWVRPDYVVKADDDAFVMLAELESRLRYELHAKLDKRGYPIEDESVQPEAGHFSPPHHVPANITADPLVYWGYLITNRFNTFMAGELYSLSWSLTEWVAKSPEVKTLIKGAEDKQTAKWMKIHPQAQRVRWVTERCWMYDHPRSGTVYGHGFLFPSEATRVRRAIISQAEKPTAEDTNNSIPSTTVSLPTPLQWAYSSVSTWGVRYSPPLPDMKTSHSVEALVEGSEMSTIREGSAMTPDYAWVHREGRIKQYEGKRVGGTIVVHFIKKNLWFLETALALLEGEDYSESEQLQMRDPSQLELSSRTIHLPSSLINRTSKSKRILR